MASVMCPWTVRRRSCQNPRIGDFMGQSVLEGVLQVWKQGRLVQELARLQVREAELEFGLWGMGDRAQQGIRNILADAAPICSSCLCSCGSLSIRAAITDYAARHLDAGQRTGQAVLPTLAPQHVGLHQRTHALLDEEGIALGTLDQQRAQRLQPRVGTQQPDQELGRALRSQRVDAQVAVEGLPPPSVLVLGAVVHQQEQARARQALD